MSLLEVRNVTAGYGDGPAVLRGVSLQIPEGEVAVLLGRNGAGKTTLTRLIVALHPPRAGEVIVGGIPVAGKRPEDLAAVVAYQFQHVDRQLFARTVEEEVAFGPRQQQLAPDEVERRVAGALGKTGLNDVRSSHPHDLSPARKKVLGIAIALSQDPGLYVLDEPTQGLDWPAAERMGRILREEAGRGKGALVVTHDLQFAADFADRLVVLEGGRVVANEVAGDFFADRHRLASLPVGVPPSVQVSSDLELSGQPFRTEDVAVALNLLLNES